NNGGTLELGATGSSITFSQNSLLLNNGSTLLASTTSTSATATVTWATSTITVADGATVNIASNLPASTIPGPNASGKPFRIQVALLEPAGYTTTPTININPNVANTGLIYFNTNEAGTFRAKWNVQHGTLRESANNGAFGTAVSGGGALDGSS